MAAGRELTPMMRQYRRVKAEHPDKIVLFHLGDFYEMFEQDAEEASRILGLTLTSRQGVPMAGIPVHASANYIRRLLEANRKVVVCDQVEDPKKAKGLVKREVTRIITPGTVIEEEFLDAARNNYILAMHRSGEETGMAWADLSTGEVFCTAVPAAETGDALERISPSEILVSEEAPPASSRPENVTCLPEYLFSESSASGRVLRHYGLASLDGLGIPPQSVPPLSALIAYLEETQLGNLPPLSRPKAVVRSETMLLDAGCLRNLEIVESVRGGTSGSLLSVLDDAVTPMGKRLLRKWLQAPSTNRDVIAARHRIVRFYKEEARVREEVRRVLRSFQDIERLASKLAAERATPRDVAALGRSAALLPELASAHRSRRLPEALRGLLASLDPLEEFTRLIRDTLSENPPASISDGGCIREGFDPEVDRLRTLRNDAKGWLADYQAKEVRRTGIQNLKVGYNRVFGYYIEVTKANASKVPDDYERRQTLTNSERYVTPELKRFERDILEAEERLRAREELLFSQLRRDLKTFLPPVRLDAALIAQMDVLAGFAEVAEKRRYVEPRMSEEPVVQVASGRHPVVEISLGPGEFVPNDVSMASGKEQIMVLTGPNMSGKSTFIRQVALMAVTAQCGSFVPAEKAVLGVFDRVFARVGAADDISGGKSTFMVEMVETARILNSASDRSLVILDEVGRGTSTFDGLSLAWAVVEYLHEGPAHPLTLFATHYHELTAMARQFPRVRNYNVAVKEWNGEVVFLHRIAPGGADRSYGIHVARLAGIPEKVVERARAILERLEEHAERLREETLPGKAPRPRQLSLFIPVKSRLADAVLALAPEQMTPLDALKTLQELKRLAEEERAGGA